MVKRIWSEVFQALKVSNFQPSLSYPATLSFKINVELKAFNEKDQLRRHEC